MKRWWGTPVAALVLASAAASGAQAQSLLVSTGGCAGSYGYGCTSWTSVTAALNTAFAGNVSTAMDLSDYAQMLAHDAVWLDQRGISGTLTATEITNLTNYVATGRRVVLIGENQNWTTWNQQLAGIVGGVYAGETFSGSTATALAHDLTEGVSSINVPAGGELAGLISGGGVSLFSREVATLWGAMGNALVMLDVNVWANSWIDLEDNRTYLNNTADWLTRSTATTTTPEPFAVLLFGSGLVGLAAAQRRRRSIPSEHENMSS